MLTQSEAGGIIAVVAMDGARSGWRRGTESGLEVVELDAAGARCRIALHGAQVLGFAPRGGGADWLWVSPRARFAAGTALRGGTPICFPWFGPHPTDRGLPAHGFARTRIWRLGGVDELPDGRMRAAFELTPDGAPAAPFPHAFRARHTVTAGDGLELAFEVANEGDAPFAFEVALHTYFAVSDVAAIAIEGLGGRAYVDRVAGGERRRQDDGPLRIEGEVDRTYDGGGPVTLVDRAPLRIDTDGAASTVVWNPGPRKAATLGDVDPDGFRRFVCIESGNVGAGRITVAPGARHTTTVRYSRI
jgi:glucose-6-phosphate 1-epimerase